MAEIIIDRKHNIKRCLRSVFGRSVLFCHYKNVITLFSPLFSVVAVLLVACVVCRDVSFYQTWLKSLILTAI